jgi:hypothetical protein
MAGSDEAELLHACIRVLYFASLIGDDMHRIRSAREVVYRQLKSRSSETHQRMRAQAEAASADLGIPPRERDLLRKYLEGTFGAR